MQRRGTINRTFQVISGRKTKTKTNTKTKTGSLQMDRGPDNWQSVSSREDVSRKVAFLEICTDKKVHQHSKDRRLRIANLFNFPTISTLGVFVCDTICLQRLRPMSGVKISIASIWSFRPTSLDCTGADEQIRQGAFFPLNWQNFLAFPCYHQQPLHVEIMTIFVHPKMFSLWKIEVMRLWAMIGA